MNHLTKKSNKFIASIFLTAFIVPFAVGICCCIVEAKISESDTHDAHHHEGAHHEEENSESRSDHDHGQCQHAQLLDSATLGKIFQPFIFTSKEITPKENVFLSSENIHITYFARKFLPLETGPPGTYQYSPQLYLAFSNLRI